jgi:hypothetical protein
MRYAILVFLVCVAGTNMPGVWAQDADPTGNREKEDTLAQLKKMERGEALLWLEREGMGFDDTLQWYHAGVPAPEKETARFMPKELGRVFLGMSLADFLVIRPKAKKAKSESVYSLLLEGSQAATLFPVSYTEDDISLARNEDVEYVFYTSRLVSVTYSRLMSLGDDNFAGHGYRAKVLRWHIRTLGCAPRKLIDHRPEPFGSISYVLSWKTLTADVELTYGRAHPRPDNQDIRRVTTYVGFRAYARVPFVSIGVPREYEHAKMIDTAKKLFPSYSAEIRRLGRKGSEEQSILEQRFMSLKAATVTPGMREQLDKHKRGLQAADAGSAEAAFRFFRDLRANLIILAALPLTDHEVALHVSQKVLNTFEVSDLPAMYESTLALCRRKDGSTAEEAAVLDLTIDEILWKGRKLLGGKTLLCAKAPAPYTTAALQSWWATAADEAKRNGSALVKVHASALQTYISGPSPESMWWNAPGAADGVIRLKPDAEPDPDPANP